MRALLSAALTVAVAAALSMPPVQAQGATDRAKVLRTAADALGMARFSDIGGANTRLPAIDIINTMELQGSGTSDMGGRQVKTDFHIAIGYNPVAARVEPESAISWWGSSTATTRPPYGSTRGRAAAQ